MKKLFLCVLIFFLIASKNIFAVNQDIKLFINGEEINDLPMNPVIINDRVLVPVREVLEKFGAELDWRPDPRELFINKNNITVMLTVDEKVAKINGQENILDVAPIIINNKLMVPVRFISETFNFEINWDDSNNQKRVIINSNTDNKNNNDLDDLDDLDKDLEESFYFDEDQNTNNDLCESILDINDDNVIRDEKSNLDVAVVDSIEFDGKNNYLIKANKKIDSISEIYLSDNRLAVNINNSVLGKNLNPKIKNLKLPNEIVKNIRAAQYQVEPIKITRVVFDLNYKTDYSVKLSDDKYKINVYLKQIKSNCKNISCDDNIIKLKKQDDLVNINKIAHKDLYYENKYVLDFPVDLKNNYGDGIFVIKNNYFSSLEVKDSSVIINQNKIWVYEIYDDQENIYIKAVSPKEKYKNIIIIDPGHGGSDSGTTNNNIKEKDLTLDIIKKILALFENDKDIKVYATRLTDTKVSLSDRVKIANNTGDLFVSVHINSAPQNIDANGTEVFYCVHKNDSQKKFTCLKLAQVLQENLLKELKSNNRKVKKENYYVLRNTEIPAALCEIGFITNQDEFEKLCTDSYRLKAAKAIYDSIKFLISK